MVDERDEPKMKLRGRRKSLPAEALWVREFLKFTGTENVSRVNVDDLNGVGLTRVVEALVLGEMISSEKCEGPGTVCTFEHISDEEDVVAVTIWFEAATGKLVILAAWRVMEDDSETHAA